MKVGDRIVRTAFRRLSASENFGRITRVHREQGRIVAYTVVFDSNDEQMVDPDDVARSRMSFVS